MNETIDINPKKQLLTVQNLNLTISETGFR